MPRLFTKFTTRNRKIKKEYNQSFFIATILCFPEFPSLGFSSFFILLKLNTHCEIITLSRPPSLYLTPSCINLNIDGTPITYRSDTRPSHSQTCPRPPRNPVYARCLNPSVLDFSLSLRCKIGRGTRWT